MSDQPSYNREFIYAAIGMDDYVRRFRDAERVAGYCRDCHNYGCHWGCPPFPYSVEDELNRYREVLLVAARIYPIEPHLPMEIGMRCLWPVRLELEKCVRSLETVLEGRAMGLAGQCSYCGARPDNPHAGMACTRSEELPCRHPELVRPSLEAWGFDISRTAEQLLQTPIIWSTDGLTPEYFTLVCACFHNASPEVAIGAFRNSMKSPMPTKSDLLSN